jgi:pimeloyl-ACP methyl ester carboxylesterase
MQELLAAALPHVDAIVSTPEGRRRASAHFTERPELLEPELVAHLMRGAAACPGVFPLLAHAAEAGWPLDAAAVACPVRIVWGTADRLLPWPRTAARYCTDWFPHADWVELDGVGHCPQLDVPLETAQLILGVTDA